MIDVRRVHTVDGCEILHHLGWLKPHRSWDVYHRFQLVIRISQQNPPYFTDGNMVPNMDKDFWRFIDIYSFSYMGRAKKNIEKNEGVVCWKNHRDLQRDFRVHQDLVSVSVEDASNMNCCCHPYGFVRQLRV